MNPSERQNKALLEVGDTGRNALYEVALPLSSSGGAWRLSFCGYFSAPLLPFASRDDVRQVLEALPGVGIGNVRVFGVGGGPYRIEMIGDLGAQFLPLETFPLVADGSLLQPSAQLIVTQLETGAAPQLSALAATRDTEYASITHERSRFLLLKRDLLDALLGETQRGIDTNVNNADEKRSQQHSNLLKLRALVQSEIEQIGTSGLGAGVPLSTPFGVKLRKTTPNGLPYGMLGLYPDGRLR